MPQNPNRVQNGGFEQSDPNLGVGPFWESFGFAILQGPETGEQLLGNNNVALSFITEILGEEIVSGISQQLLPLQVGEYYEFNMSIALRGLQQPEGTLEVAISGTPLRSFQVTRIPILGDYVQYSFPFQATVADATLTITNNSNQNIFIDVVSLFLK